jgi:hypothetical protein
MATLLLTAAGTAIGGPIGGAIGAIIGQSVDAKLLKPKGRQGPRLGDLAVQTSSYGSAIPKLFGTIRVAGTVIWATDLSEERSKSGGGKGRPSTTSYSYSASFAVALSGREILGVRRIWADGKLLRGAAGDFKSATEYRLYLGDEEQKPDPLIVAEEGVGSAPAFRGIAYALFEDFQLADYGNRIPSLTFEVEADMAPVLIGAIAETLSEGAVVNGVTPAIRGYAANGDSVRGAIEALGDLVPLSFAEQGDALILLPPPGSVDELDEGVLGASAGDAGGRSEVRRAAAGAIAVEIGLSYYDPARDYQTGLQRATRGAPRQKSEQFSVAAVLDAGVAKAFAEARLAQLWAGRSEAVLHVPWRLSGLRPSDVLRIPGEAGRWRVERWTLDRMVTTLQLRKLAGVLPADAEANPGRPASNPDMAHGATHIVLRDLPLGAEELPSRARLFAAAAGEEAGWRRAALMTSFDGGVSWEPIGASTQPAIMGVATNAIGVAGSALFDEVNSIEVELLNDAMWLESREDAALAAGANLAALGSELIQFGSVEPLGGNRFRLSRLLRGRLGSEWAADGHEAGEDFVLIEADSFVLVEPRAASLGAEVRLLASGIADVPEGVLATASLTGEAIRPPAPVHLQAERLGSGAIAIHWTRRSRNGWAWLDGGGAPLGEESEAYRLTLSGDGFERNIITLSPTFLYSAEAQASDGLAGSLTIDVVQLGSLAASRSARLIVD